MYFGRTGYYVILWLKRAEVDAVGTAGKLILRSGHIRLPIFSLRSFSLLHVGVLLYFDSRKCRHRTESIDVADMKSSQFNRVLQIHSGKRNLVIEKCFSVQLVLDKIPVSPFSARQGKVK
jgi:hypothetical protein